MKNLVKSSLSAMAFVCAFAATQSASAGEPCGPVYAKKMANLKTSLVSNKDQAITTTGAAASVVLQTPDLAISSSLAATAVVGAGTSTSAVQEYRAHQVKKVYRLLHEADLGAGLLLEEMALKLNLTTEFVAKTIVDANYTGVFCSEQEGLYSYGDILSFVNAAGKK